MATVAAQQPKPATKPGINIADMIKNFDKAKKEGGDRFQFK
jgi:hypothetical protein